MSNGLVSRWVRGLGAALLVVAVLPLSAGPAAADAPEAKKQDTACQGNAPAAQGNGRGNRKDCPPAETVPESPAAGTPAVDPVSPVGAAPATSSAAAPAQEEQKTHGKPAAAEKDKGKPAEASPGGPPVASDDAAKPDGRPASSSKASDHKADAPNGRSDHNAAGPKGRGPKTDAPKADGPKAEGPKAEEPKADGPKGAGHTPVNVCHATGSDTNPYVFITVDDDSVKAEGHLMHRNTPNKTWKSDGFFRGVAVKAGDPKPDLIGDYVDSSGVLHVLDGRITSAADCGAFTPPPPPPPVVAPTGSFDTVCTATAARATVGTLSGGSTPGSFRLVGGATSTTVSTGSIVDVPADTEIQLQFVATSGVVTLVQTKRSAKACPAVTAELTKTAVPGSGSVVTPGQTISYTVTVLNTGQAAISSAPVVDTLPAFVSVVAGSVSGGGVVSPDGRTITWTVTLAPGAGATFTYQGLVATNAPLGSALVNKVTFLLQERTTTHQVGDRSLEVRKAVSPTSAVELGDRLTYTLTVKALGNLGQTSVVVRDKVPAGTTYVDGSAACDAAGPCASSFGSNEVTWQLGAMAAGATRTVSFQVDVVDPRTSPEDSVPAITIRNVGVASSVEVPPTPSNEVVTEVVAVGGVKTGPNGPEQPSEVEVVPNAGGSLPRTGAGLPLGGILAAGAILFCAGLLLLRVGWPARDERMLS